MHEAIMSMMMKVHAKGQGNGPAASRTSAGAGGLVRRHRSADRTPKHA